MVVFVASRKEQYVNALSRLNFAKMLLDVSIKHPSTVVNPYTFEVAPPGSPEYDCYLFHCEQSVQKAQDEVNLFEREMAVGGLA